MPKWQPFSGRYFTSCRGRFFISWHSAAVISVVDVSAVDISAVDFFRENISAVEKLTVDISAADISVEEFLDNNVSAIILLSYWVCFFKAFFLQASCPHGNLTNDERNCLVSDFQCVICGHIIYNTYFLCKLFLLNFDRFSWTYNGKRRPQMNS